MQIETIIGFVMMNVVAFSASANNLLLTGEIKAGEVQNFTVPWSQNWRQQIKWLKPEGEIVEAGELVILFDTASLDSQIEQQEVNLQQTKDKAKQSIIDLEQRVIDAEHNLVNAKLDFQLADLSAKVPSRFRSNYEADNLGFDLKKAKTLLTQAERDLKAQKEALSAEKKKQDLSIQQIVVELEKHRQQQSRLQLKADRKGTFLHALHPWDGTKISEGQSVQTSWNVGSIPGVGGEWIEAWVNEVDWHKIKSNANVQLTLDAYPEQNFDGRVTNVSQQSEKRRLLGTAAYYQVKIEMLKKPRKKIVPGMSVLVNVPEYQSDSEKVTVANRENLDMHVKGNQVSEVDNE